MTVTLVTAPLTTETLAALEAEFGWQVLTVDGKALLDGAGYEPSSVGALLVESELVDHQVLERFPRLSVVGCVRGNPVNVDIEMATRLGVVVIGAPARNAESVTDLVFGLTLSVVRHIARAHHMVISRELTEERDEVRPRKDVVWRPSNPAAPFPYRLFKGPELASLVLGLLGFGAIGSRVGVRGVAIGMRVVAFDPGVPSAKLISAGVQPVGFDELFRQSDVVSLHAPPQQGRPLVGERELALMKPSAYLINTARASVLDYDALVDALRLGRLAGAGLDVFPDEPLSSTDPLLDLPNVTLTPHIGGASANVIEHHSAIILGGLRALAQGYPEGADVRNPDVLAHWPKGIPPALAEGMHDDWPPGGYRTSS